jgi:hypothetical protein
MPSWSVSHLTASGFALCVFSTQSLAPAQNTQESRLPGATQAEEIYIVRSVPESLTPPTAFCALERIGFSGPNFEGQYTFRSTATSASDGRMVDMNVKTIGSIHLCTGPTSDPTIINFYGEGLLGRTPFKGLGECRRRPDLPERGLVALNCFLNLSGLPSQFVGGLLTTNSMGSRSRLGMETDPPGYTQSSIATIRLWKKRTER